MEKDIIRLKEKLKRLFKKRDVVQCPPNVNHWHGATGDSGMTHIYLIPNTEKGIVEWGDPVEGKEINDRIDNAYREKYECSPYLKPMISEQARSATIRIKSHNTDS